MQFFEFRNLFVLYYRLQTVIPLRIQVFYNLIQVRMDMYYLGLFVSTIFQIVIETLISSHNFIKTLSLNY